MEVSDGSKRLAVRRWPLSARLRLCDAMWSPASVPERRSKIDIAQISVVCTDVVCGVVKVLPSSVPGLTGFGGR